MMEKLYKYLDDIENRIDADQEDKLFSDWVTFAEGNWHENYFSPKRKRLAEPSIEWPYININDAIDDYELMIISQFAMCSQHLSKGTGSILTVRGNYGVGIIPSIFGAEKFIMDYKADTLPNVYPLKNGKDDIKRIINSDISEFSTGWGENIFVISEMYNEIFEKYPKIKKYVRIDHPDTQGPMDLCELLWGSDLFLDLYDCPDMVHQFLAKLTDTYKNILDKYFSVVPNKDHYHSYFGSIHKGSIMIRNDSAVNLSADMCREFVSYYNNELLDYFGGGAIHFCGRGDHYSQQFGEMEKLYAVNLSQPECNDMEVLFQNTIDKGINIITLPINEAVNRNRGMKGLVHTDNVPDFLN